MAGAAYRLPFEDDGDWRVANGNWDDPERRHGTSQAYAYDFAHPIGGKVRAARGGVVVDTLTTETVNTHDHPGAGNDGGNHVYIRHSDDTVAIYYHLNPGDVFVEPRDVVAQGQVIARSGNTGNSTGPHLHFQVLSFWNSNGGSGPTIPVFFEDKTHGHFRPRRDEAIASNNAALRDENWRRCTKCQTLFLGDRRSRCPAGATHDPDQTRNFVLQRNIGKAYFFNGARYRRYDVAADGVDIGFPATIANNWPGNWESGIDTAVVWNNGKAYFFKGNHYIRYDVVRDRADDGVPKISDHWTGLWEDDIDAAVLWIDGAAYFFKGSECIRYSIEHDRAERGFPAPIAKHFPGVWESGIDAVVVWDNGKAYFFKGDEYIRYDIGGNQADEHFPAKISKFWSGLEGGIDAAVLWPDTGKHEWRRCGKCDGLVSHIRGTSRCPAGGAHERADRVEYSLVEDSIAAGPETARLCHKCAGLFFGSGAASACAAGGKHEAAEHALKVPTVVTEIGQEGWSWCQKCQGLFLSTNPNSSCPVQGTHDASTAYVLLVNSPAAPGEHDWRACSKCAGLFHGGNARSVCPKGGPHAKTNDDYALVRGFPPGDGDGTVIEGPGEYGWRECLKCAGLFWGKEISLSRCPDGGPHAASGAALHLLMHS